MITPTETGVQTNLSHPFSCLEFETISRHWSAVTRPFLGGINAFTEI